jgi:siroheme decarboxylase
MELTDTQKRLINALQNGFPLVYSPYKEIGERLGMSEAEVLKELATLKDMEVVRRICVIVRHKRLGYTANAMVVWCVPEDCIQSTGKIMASYPEISHCYTRATNETWQYNLYTMIHAHDEDELNGIIKRLAKDTGITKHIILKTLKEFKKESMKYVL